MLGRYLMVAYCVLALLAITPGTTCVLLSGLGIGHFHLGEENEAVSLDAHDDFHHSCESHSHGLEDDPSGPIPVPCPDAEGVTLESDLTMAKTVEVNPVVWTLAAVAIWSEHIALPSGFLNSGQSTDDSIQNRGLHGEHRVLLCRFLI